MMGLNAALPMIIAAHQVACGTCAWCLAGRGWPEQRQLTRHAYPGQPATRPEHVVQRCRCTYRLGGMYGTGSYFVIAPECPHHGLIAHREVIVAIWDDPMLNVLRDPYDLDDNERRL